MKGEGKRRKGRGRAYRPRCQIELLFTADGREISNARVYTHKKTVYDVDCVHTHAYTYEHRRRMMRVGRGARA